MSDSLAIYSPSSPATPSGSASSGAAPSPSNFSLVDNFSVFWDEVVRQKRRVTSGTSGSAGAPSPYDTLLGILNQQAAAAKQAESSERYSQAQYVMAVFADEVFLGMVWPGRAAWAANPLEQQLFGTQDGQDEVFDRIDALLARGVRTDPDLAKVYLFALGLGFRGRYKGSEETVHLDAYREELYRAIYGTNPGTLPGAGRLFPEAYMATRSQGEPQKLPQVRGWVVAFLVILLAFGVASHVLWRQATAEVRSQVEKILALP
ncbi:MAG TPA: DotU family type IV/VI secretion system protein [Thermoanaerobaculia bacterium]|nr:DotU family type IV/VI secretion system protein [Thermoanaerobaculia bacterium]